MFEPPFALIERMLTMRVHLEAETDQNAPLLDAPGTHCLGRIPESGIGSTVSASGVTPCVALEGDVWLYPTPILHTSDSAVVPSRRRLLQVDFSPILDPGRSNGSASERNSRHSPGVGGARGTRYARTT